MNTIQLQNKPVAFPEYLNVLRELLPELVAILEEGRAWYAFAFLEDKITRQVNIQRTESNSTEVDRGLVLRIVADGKNFESATNELEPGHLRGLARDLKERVDQVLGGQAVGLTHRPLAWREEALDEMSALMRAQIPPGAGPNTPVHFSVPCELNPFATSVKDITDLARSVRAAILARDAAYRADQPDLAELASVAVTIRQQISTYVFVDREKNMSQTLPLSMAIVRGMSAKGGTGRVYAGGLGGLEIVHLKPDEIEEAAVRPHRLDRAERIEPGVYTVITGPDVTGVFAHEAFGHTQEGDTCLQGRSIAPRMRAEGQRAGNDAATIVNDPGLFEHGPHDFGTNGSYFFDHEGQLARPQVILDRGILTAPMTDLRTALKLGVPRTANGKRESWRRPTLTRQTNTYISAGDRTLDEIVAMVDYGFLAEVSHGGMEDPKGARLTVGAEYLEEIKDGKRTGRLFVGGRGGHVELSGYVPELLGGIRAKTKADPFATGHEVSLAPENKIGGCGKYHKEAVSAGCGGPYVLWDRVMCG